VGERVEKALSECPEMIERALEGQAVAPDAPLADGSHCAEELGIVAQLLEEAGHPGKAVGLLAHALGTGAASPPEMEAFLVSLCCRMLEENPLSMPAQVALELQQVVDTLGTYGVIDVACVDRFHAAIEPYLGPRLQRLPLSDSTRAVCRAIRSLALCLDPCGRHSIAPRQAATGLVQVFRASRTFSQQELASECLHRLNEWKEVQAMAKVALMVCDQPSKAVPISASAGPARAWMEANGWKLVGRHGRGGGEWTLIATQCPAAEGGPVLDFMVACAQQQSNTALCGPLEMLMGLFLSDLLSAKPARAPWSFQSLEIDRASWVLGVARCQVLLPCLPNSVDSVSMLFLLALMTGSSFTAAALVALSLLYTEEAQWPGDLLPKVLAELLCRERRRDPDFAFPPMLQLLAMCLPERVNAIRACSLVVERLHPELPILVLKELLAVLHPDRRKRSFPVPPDAWRVLRQQLEGTERSWEFVYASLGQHDGSLMSSSTSWNRRLGLAAIAILALIAKGMTAWTSTSVEELQALIETVDAWHEDQDFRPDLRALALVEVLSHCPMSKASIRERLAADALAALAAVRKRYVLGRNPWIEAVEKKLAQEGFAAAPCGDDGPGSTSRPISIDLVTKY